MFTMEEMWWAVGKIQSGKAGGPDGFPSEVVRLFILERPEYCLEVFNNLLVSGTFPVTWKRTRLVLLPKKAIPGEPVAYRPICIANVCAKVLEHLIQYRLRKEMLPLSPLQFGYRQGLSTVDALEKVLKFGMDARKRGMYAMVIALDIKNAFNCVAWERIDEAMGDKMVPSYIRKMIRSYLSGRKLAVGDKDMEITAGVPQGSVLGPLLWCLFYDQVLEMEMERDVDFCCYADDLGLLVAAKTLVKIKARANRAIAQVIQKFTEMGLVVAGQKTEAVMLWSKRDDTPVPVKVEQDTVWTSPAIRYLGMWIGRDLNMDRHVEEKVKSATRTGFSLGTLMPKSGGPGDKARRLLASVVYSVVLYGVRAWEGLMTAAHWSELEAAVKRTMISVCRGYRTMSAATAGILSGLPPIRRKAEALIARWNGESRQQAELEMRKRWAEDWLERDQDGWARKLLVDPMNWLARNHGEMDRNLAQLLSGHGLARVYLHKRRLASSDECLLCGERDTTEHAFFLCQGVRHKRVILEGALGSGYLDLGSVVRRMCESQEVWKAVAIYAGHVVRAKREADRFV